MNNSSFDKFLISVKDEEWKSMRAIISTTFSSGKLKLVRKAPYSFQILNIILNQNSFKMSKNMVKLAKNMSAHLVEVAEGDKILETKQ